MAFYRFEDLQTHHLNPHLSATRGPVIEGDYMYFRRVTKEAGSRSRPHYHPNEFMAFFLRGRSHATLGNERRVAKPGMLVHIPSNARHSFKAIEDVEYLYIKDRTWTLIGAAANRALPKEAMSAPELAQALARGENPALDRHGGASQAIVDGLGDCFYPWLERLDAPVASGHHEHWLEGKNLCFGLIDTPAGHTKEEAAAAHELFAYVISGSLATTTDEGSRVAREGDVIHVCRGSAYSFAVPQDAPSTRYAVVRSTSRLEDYVAQNGAADNWRG
jgi:quercetin dioxygenase-like cupin family protein